MPFRLTQQFVNLIQPLKESGLIQSTMVHSLRAFRAEPDLLLNTMDVFVKEPSLDWKVTKTPAEVSINNTTVTELTSTERDFFSLLFCCVLLLLFLPFRYDFGC